MPSVPDRHSFRNGGATHVVVSQEPGPMRHPSFDFDRISDCSTHGDSHELSLLPTRDSVFSSILLSLDRMPVMDSGKYQRPIDHVLDPTVAVFPPASSAASPAAPSGYSPLLSRARRGSSSSELHSSFFSHTSVMSTPGFAATTPAAELTFTNQFITSPPYNSMLPPSSSSTVPSALVPSSSLPSAMCDTPTTPPRHSRNECDRRVSVFPPPPPCAPTQSAHPHAFQTWTTVLSAGWDDQPSRLDLSQLPSDDLALLPEPTAPAGRRRPASQSPIANSFADATGPSVPPARPPLSSSSADSAGFADPVSKFVGLERNYSIRTSRSTVTMARFRLHRSSNKQPTRDASYDPDFARTQDFDLEKLKEPFIATVLTPPASTTPRAACPRTAAQATTKDRPGFFRRVFGSSKLSNQCAPLEISPVSSVVSATLDCRPSSQNSHPPYQGPTRPLTPPLTCPPAPNIIHRKASSIFRRKKSKSVIGLSVLHSTPPPIPTIPHHCARPSSVGPESFPALSPRPFTQSDRYDLYHENFSPEYEPSLTARIRTIGAENFSPFHAHVAAATEHKTGLTPDSSSQTRPTHSGPARRRIHASAKNVSSLDINGVSDHESVEDKPQHHAFRSPGVAGYAPGQRRTGSEGDGPHADTLRARVAPVPAPQPGVNPDLNNETGRPAQSLPIEGIRSTSPASGSTSTEYKSAASGPPSASHEMADTSALHMPPYGSLVPTMNGPHFLAGDLTDDDRLKAGKIYNGDEDLVSSDRAAAWMGEIGLIRQRTLRAYLDLFDLADLPIVGALRRLCTRLILRAETQQVDRILAAFAMRWCHCNPSHGFKSAVQLLHSISQLEGDQRLTKDKTPNRSDVVHTICYSIMLLNTDLHLADIDQKMTRSQFVKNTITTIRHALAESDPGSVIDRPSILPGRSHLHSGVGVDENLKLSSRRGSFRPPARVDACSMQGGAMDFGGIDDCGPLVKSPFDGSMRLWELQVETVLKNTYTSIRDVRLPLHGAESHSAVGSGSAGNSLTIMGILKRTPSVLSKTPSESQSSMRGRMAEPLRGPGYVPRWTSKSRSRPRFGGGLGAPGGETGISSSRTSLDEGNSMWSPVKSSAAFSRYSLGRTHTSMSVDSFGSVWPRGLQSIGFANALNQALTRDVVPTTATSTLSTSQVAAGAVVEGLDETTGVLLTDESLELAGPPWAKEGMVVHKHHLEAREKKAKKDRNWVEVFAVVQKGTLSLFSFAPNRSMRQKSRVARLNAAASASHSGLVVGGGNWQDNATELGSFTLHQALASILPPPGCSSARPHVWALSLPTGAIHLFQVGTPDIAREFVLTANYWSSRVTAHPLVGGISNVEYGWSEAIVNNSLVQAINEDVVAPPPRTSRPGSSATRPGTGATVPRRTSIQSGTVSPLSVEVVGSGMVSGTQGRSGGGNSKLPADRIHISDWTAPTMSMRASTLSETRQLKSLRTYVRAIETELQSHNRLRAPMQLAFSPRSPNAGRALANWERRSAHLLQEIVKFRTYVDVLEQAGSRRAEVYAERDSAGVPAVVYS